jgi:preprotein translocase subunit SecY
MAIRKTSTCARHTASGDFEQDMMGGNRQWIPLKLNASGVMPIILLKQLCLYLLLTSLSSVCLVVAGIDIFGCGII